MRLDTVDYSVHPRVIGRFVDVVASRKEVTVASDGKLVVTSNQPFGRWGETASAAGQAA